MQGFVDAHWVGYLYHIMSTSGYVFNLFGGEISCMSNRLGIVAFPTTKAEYMASTHGSKEAIWLQIFCSSIGFFKKEVRIGYDNSSVIFLEKNPTYHSKTKHIYV